MTYEIGRERLRAVLAFRTVCLKAHLEDMAWQSKESRCTYFDRASRYTSSAGLQCNKRPQSNSFWQNSRPCLQL
jgi:AMMECR1 domain-containing protein